MGEIVACARCSKRFRALGSETYCPRPKCAQRAVLARLEAVRWHAPRVPTREHVRVPPLPRGPLTWLTVARRDGWACYLCGVTCSRESGRYRDDGTWKCGPLYPTLDHVIPKAKGGPHTLENVRLACHRCNCSKHVRDLDAFLIKKAFVAMLTNRATTTP